MLDNISYSEIIALLHSMYEELLKVVMTFLK